MTPKIQERASEIMRTTGHPLNAREAYIAAAAEQQSLSEARIKELEEENKRLKRKLDIAENTYWNELE